MDAHEYLRLVLDPVRLAVLGASAAGPLDPPGLAATLGVPVKKVLEAAGRLRAAGLLTASLELDRSALSSIGASRPRLEPPAGAVLEGPWNADEVEVMRRFFAGSRLREIPAQRAKRLVVLERLAMEFEPGVRYGERQVDLILQTFHRDYAALRRYLIDEELLTRADGVYWRSGGRVSVG